MIFTIDTSLVERHLVSIGFVLKQVTPENRRYERGDEICMLRNRGWLPEAFVARSFEEAGLDMPNFDVSYGNE